MHLAKDLKGLHYLQIGPGRHNISHWTVYDMHILPCFILLLIAISIMSTSVYLLERAV